MSYRLLIAALVTAIWQAVIMVPVAAAVPSADGMTARDVSSFYSSGLTSAFNWESFTFIDPGDKPPMQSLSNLERYMIAGTEPRAGQAFDPWYVMVFSFAAAYYKNFGSLPDTLTPEMVRSIPGQEQVSDDILERLRNPLTGNWPRLKAQDFSPGDIYLQPLTPAEMQHFATALPNLGKVWIEGLTIDTDSALDGADPADCFTQRCELYAPPFYVKVYGHSGVLLTDFICATLDK